MFTYKRMTLDPYFTPLTKLNSKSIENLNVRPDTIKCLQENRGVNLLDIGLGKDILAMTPKAQSNKSKNRQASPHQTKKVLYSKGNRQQQSTEKIYAMADCKLYI